MAAAAAAQFSIRGYAARARAGAADERGRCWPFGGEAGRLPPMEVRGFRWWGDEAAAAAALAEEEGEEERRLAAKRRKRSIVELFAVVPKVAAGGEGVGREKRVRRKPEKGEAAAVGVEAAKKKGFKKEKVVVEIGIRKKVKSSKMKVNSASMSQLVQDAIQKQKLKKSLSKKKGILLEKKRMKVNKVAILSNQKATKSSCHVQSILKNHLRTGMSTLLKNTDVMSPSKSLLKPKHVTFSDDNDILGRTASQLEDDTDKAQLLETSQQPYKYGKSQGDDNHRSTYEQPLMHQQADAVSESVKEDTNSTVQLAKSKEKTILSNSVDLNHSLEISRSGNCLTSNSSAVLSGQVLSKSFSGIGSDPIEGLNAGVGFQAEENHHKHHGSSVSASLAVKGRSGDLIRQQLPEPSRSCLVASLNVNDRNRSKMLQERSATVHPTLCRSKDMVKSIGSSAGSNKSTDAQTTNCVSACRNMYTSDGYVGLPINSHGEFVKLHRSGTVDPNGMFKRKFLGENYLQPPASFAPETCMDYAHLKTSYQVPRFCAVNTFGFQSEPYQSHTVSAAYGMGVRQSPSSERIEAHNYAVPSHTDSYNNQQELSVECFCPGYMVQDNQAHKPLEMHSCFPSQNYEQNTRPAPETTVRLMGKNFTLGTSSKQCGGIDNKNPYRSKQIRDEDHCTKAIPQLFHGDECVEPHSTLRNSNGGLEHLSCFSSVPEAELRCALDAYGFGTSGRYQQPHVAVQNKLYAHPLGRHNESELWRQQLPVENHILGVSEPQLLGSMHLRQSQNSATMQSYSPKHNFNNPVEVRPGHPQFAYFPRQIKNVTQRTPISSFLSGYAVQSSTGLTTQTKFTSLRPLPPSVTSSHVYSSEDAQSHGSVPPFYPPTALSDQASENSILVNPKIIGACNRL